MSKNNNKPSRSVLNGLDLNVVVHEIDFWIFHLLFPACSNFFHSVACRRRYFAAEVLVRTYHTIRITPNATEMKIVNG